MAFPVILSGTFFLYPRKKVLPWPRSTMGDSAPGALLFLVSGLGRFLGPFVLDFFYSSMGAASEGRRGDPASGRISPTCGSAVGPW